MGGPPPGGYGAPGGFGPPGYPPPGGMPGADVNTTLPMVLSIICLACCCLPMGIGGLIFAMNANNAKKMGDLATAQSKAKTSLILSIVGMVGGAIIATVYGVIMAMNQST
jgi:hypothetical protein